MLFVFFIRSTKGTVTVIDEVRMPSNDTGFPGLFVDNLNPKCWSDDSKRIVVDTLWRSRHELLVIHVETGQVTRLTNDPLIGSWILLDVTKDLILSACSSPSQPQYLVLGKLPGEGQETSIEWMRLDAEPRALPEVLFFCIVL
jgi:acylaminoacyl-peptidase